MFLFLLIANPRLYRRDRDRDKEEDRDRDKEEDRNEGRVGDDNDDDDEDEDDHRQFATTNYKCHNESNNSPVDNIEV